MKLLLDRMNTFMVNVLNNSFVFGTFSTGHTLADGSYESNLSNGTPQQSPLLCS